jgi:hypothetical protein
LCCSYLISVFSLSTYRDLSPTRPVRAPVAISARVGECTRISRSVCH